LKYYEEAPRQEAFNQLPFDDPIEFANELFKTLDSEFDQTGIRQSPVKDPTYLGTLGFNIELLNQGVAVEEMREKSLPRN